MSMPKINEGRLILAVITELLMICSALACSGKIMLRSGLTDYDKQIIINAHNRMRQAVALGRITSQPPAANMVEMKWDEELAVRAQQWAECESHLHDNKRHISRFLVGQNMASSWGSEGPSSYYETKPDFIADAISKWFNEEKKFHYGRITRGTVGHYTQIVWAETNLVGCGYAYYLDPVGGYTKNYVCNYGPSGNVQGELPYEKGYTNCRQYGLTESKSYTGLCVASTKGQQFEWLHFLNYN